MKHFKLWNNILGWGTFAIAAFVYLSTIEPTASWWDCGEYIATAFKLQVGHPPGAPLFQLVGRFFSLFAGDDVTKVAMMINSMSALFSALTILFLFWSITMLALKLAGNEEEMSLGKSIAVLGSGLVGALAYTFTDSFWFSAVEGEVYAMSSFFTAIVFWAILKWERVHDQPHSLRWIVLIGFLIGLSIGVHLLNLLTIPAIALVIYFRKYKSTGKGVLTTLAISFALLAVVLFLIIPQTVKLAGKYEIFFVNNLGLPFNTGTAFYFLLLIGTIIWSLRFTYRNKHTIIEYATGITLMLLTAIFSGWLVVGVLAIIMAYYLYKNSNSWRKQRDSFRSVVNTAILSFTFILIGYSSFFMLVIRANANPPINENAPSDAVSMLSYLLREQYGDQAPLFYGQYYNAPVVEYSDASPIYVRDNEKGKYIITDDRKESNAEYDSRFKTIFPRMWTNREQKYINGYISWGKVTGTPLEVKGNDNQMTTVNKPTFVENMRYFFSYQLGHMYMRYFMWNFSGRQNDIEGHGGIRYGGWLSGIPFWDKARLGDQSDLPRSMENKAHNVFYMLPFLLGLIGLFFHFNRNFNGALTVLMLFLMTGIAIVVYLNFPPQQPRERDYAFAGSFYAFAIWIGLGVYFLWEKLKKYNETAVAIGLTAVCLVLVPGIMAREGWDDHDRSNKYAARDYAKNYLNSCEPNAVLFTNGDNDTFPLWYIQEVEDVRTDVRVVNFMLSASDWYVHQLMRKVYQSDKLPFTLSYKQYDKGVNEVMYYSDMVKDRIELKDLVTLWANEDPRLKGRMGNHEVTLLPSKKIRITLDSAALMSSGAIPENLKDKVVGYIDLDLKSNYITKNELMFLDFLSNNDFKRPIYFASPAAMSEFADLDKYCYQEGFVYRFLPVKPDVDFVRGFGSVNALRTYDIMMNKSVWGNLEKPGVYVDRESMRNSYFPKQSFARLARKLIYLDEKDSAAKVCDKVIQVFPDDKFPFDELMLQFLEVYYRAEQFDKGNKLAATLLTNYEDKIVYILKLKQEHQANYNDDLQTGVEIIGAIRDLSTQFNQKNIADRADKFLKSLGVS